MMTDASINYDQMIALAMGDMAADEAAALERRIAADPEAVRAYSCIRAIVTALRESGEYEPSAEAVARAKAEFNIEPRSVLKDWLAAVDAWIASLVFDSRSQPALAGFRGTAEAVRLSYEAGEFDIDLEIELAERDGRPIAQLMGQISGPDEDGDVDIAATQAASSTIVRATTADESGTFTLSLEPGAYDLYFRTPGGVVAVKDVQIG